MKKIEYENVKDYEREYLKIFNSISNKKNIEPALKILQSEWDRLRNKYSLLNYHFPKKITRLVLASYKKLVSYTILLRKCGLDFFLLQREFDKTTCCQIVEKFDYDKFHEKIADFFKKNADKLKIHSCFYCDAAYTGVFSTEEEVRRTFDVDHFFPKSEYPMFCLSLYNFVPSCQVCNSRIKGQKNFLKFYSLEKDSSLRKLLSQVSPAGKKYDMDSNLTIKVYPEKNDKESNQPNHEEGLTAGNEWHYTPVFSKNSENYRILFDVNEKTAYKNVVSAFLLEERYNNIAIKSQALYLMDLKKKYPDSNIKFLSHIINKTFLSRNKSILISPEEIKRTIFHNDNKYSLLQKLRNDIVDYDIFDE